MFCEIVSMKNSMKQFNRSAEPGSADLNYRIACLCGFFEVIHRYSCECKRINEKSTELVKNLANKLGSH